ncbi:MAG: hypothetical protein PWQ83_1090 [Thermosipho sp. (in: thermotogales)]|nr:hypothetical protein [Thermosipho sp. (in: thermotogales)]
MRLYHESLSHLLDLSIRLDLLAAILEPTREDYEDGEEDYEESFIEYEEI